MKQDVLNMLDGCPMVKRPSKETLNHRGIIELASGIDVYSNTSEAYLAAYQALGIDILNRIPSRNAPVPTSQGESVRHNELYNKTYLGVYDTYIRYSYPFDDYDDFLKADYINLDYNGLITPVPHRLDLECIQEKSLLASDIGVYYYQLYTTLFMWGVEVLGWEMFMIAATCDPEIFDRKFLEPAFQQSLKLIKILCKAETPFVFAHDDLADARGPIFRPSFYDKYIYPRYQKLWDIVHESGKKVIFVADGDMTELLPDIYRTGVDGVMIETPATPLECILSYFGDKIVIGGIDTGELTFGTPRSVRDHVLAVDAITRNIERFVLSASGGLHGNIPLENLEAYFDTRVEIGFTQPNWRAEHR